MHHRQRALMLLSQTMRICGSHRSALAPPLWRFIDFGVWTLLEVVEIGLILIELIALLLYSACVHTVLVCASHHRVGHIGLRFRLRLLSLGFAQDTFLDPLAYCAFKISAFRRVSSGSITRTSSTVMSESNPLIASISTGTFPATLPLCIPACA